MIIRKADKNDIQSIMNLLRQVLDVHASVRPDIFKSNTTKYTDEELYYIVSNPLTPVFVAEDEGEVLGHCFCKFIRFSKDHVLTDIKTLYIDDICVDEKARHKGVGKALYNFTQDFAKSENCYNITLNVWNGNESAIKFYEYLGLSVQKITMEKIL